ncbi:MAG: pyruvate, phosphate dikinase [Candidatus Moranbacteria bacterium]|nr:pyruvate, phosphate dikinase [Candidatus Moranbacteria bacterium]
MKKELIYLLGESNGKNPLPTMVLGGKGKAIDEMSRDGMPVPPAFTLRTGVSRAFMQEKCLPRRLAWHLKRGMSELEKSTGRRFGDPANPLLVSVRSGAAVSMPGMMDTILNLGLNPETTMGLGRIAGERFAWDSYRRFLSLFGTTVLGVSKESFESFLSTLKKDLGVADDSHLSVDILKQVCDVFRIIIKQASKVEMPDDPWQQLTMALLAVMESWKSERAMLYREKYDIPEWHGTAVNVQAMVFGNLNDRSCTGVVFSRNVATGEKGLYGEFLVNAQGEDVVSGARTPSPIAEMQLWDRELHDELERLVMKLEAKYQDVVDVEFTVENGKLYILQSRIAKRTPEAAATVAVHMFWDKTWDRERSLDAVTPEQVWQLHTQSFDADALKSATIIARGIPASPGAIVGTVTLSSRSAVELAARGKVVILVRPDTSPDDLSGMLASVGVITGTGGSTSHAAVVCRGMGKPAVVGCDIDSLKEGGLVSIDGATGTVFLGEVKRNEANKKKEVNIFLRWVDRFRRIKRKPRIGFEYYGKRESFNRLLNDFYLSEAIAAETASTEASQLREKIHTTTAEHIACYLAIAVAGELRHARSITREISSYLKEFDISLGGERLPAQGKIIAILKNASDPKKGIRFFEGAVKAFRECEWKEGFGGSQWAQIAEAPINYLAGTVSDSVFVDHAFDLQHNNGSVFGKHDMLYGSRDLLQSQLEAKKLATGNARELRKKLSWICNEFSPEVIAMLEKN